jgi:hypothetical protein
MTSRGRGSGAPQAAASLTAGTPGGQRPLPTQKAVGLSRKVWIAYQPDVYLADRGKRSMSEARTWHRTPLSHTALLGYHVANRASSKPDCESLRKRWLGMSLNSALGCEK